MGRVLHRLREERGMALVMALGVMMVLGIAVTSLSLYATSNEKSAHGSKARLDVYQLAVAGVENFASQLSQVDPLNRDEASSLAGLTTSDRTQTFGTGESVTWEGRLYDVRQGPNVLWNGVPLTASYIPRLVWKVTSTATAPNPTTGGTLTKTITADVPLRPQTTQTRNTDAWSYVFSTETNDPDGCDMELPNNPNVQSSFYVSGNLCLDNNSSIVGPQSASDPPVKLVVRGNAILLKNGNDLGTAAQPLTSVYVEGALGCKFRANPYHTPCTAVDHVRPNSLSGSAPVTAPVAAWDEWFVHGSPGPNEACDADLSSGDYAFLVDNGVQDLSLGTIDIAPGTNYSCKTLTGELTWDATSRVLTVSGTMYLDGNVNFDVDGTIDYDGVAAMYVGGYFRMHQTLLCAIVAAGVCDTDVGNWNTDTDMLMVAARASHNFGPSCSGCSTMLEQSSVFQGALYGDHDIGFQNNSGVHGPMIANQELIQNSFTFHYLPPLANVPFGAPGNVITRWDALPPTNFSG